ncbi:MAG: hypothetical protein HOP19_00640, partial [Acidobacteria bacterium]|nr:hypothetical protein [Acidobacteriota bacterium]
MKTGKWSFSVVVALTALSALSAWLCQRPFASKTASAHQAALQGPAAVQQLKQSNSFNSLSAAYQAARYHIEAAPDALSWHSQNPAHHFQASFRRSTVEGAKNDVTAGVQLQADRARLGLQLRAIGYEQLLVVQAVSEPHAQNNRIEFQHATEAQSRVTEWFVNDANGLEHGFTLNEPIAPRSSQPLQLRMHINSELRAQADEQSVTWFNAEGEIVWRYAGLRAWDANGATLAATMNLQADELTLSVDDATAVYPLTIDPTFTLQRQLVAGPAADAFFGSSVALDGDTAVIGAEGEDLDGSDREGAVYVFTRSGSLWTLQARLRAADGAARDQLGRQVAVLGDTLAASAPFHNIGAAADRGAVYVFTRSGGVWTQQQKLVANDGAASDLFGESLAIANNQLLVGAPNRNEANKADSGAAYYFTRSGTTWSQTQKLLPSVGTANDKFGESVAMVTGLNGALAIGAPGFESDGPANQGTVYIFLPVMGVWVASGQLFANDAGADDAFGSALALSGGTLVVGAYLDDVAGITNAGSAYVYVRNGNAFAFQQKLLPSDAGAKQFGYAVSVEGDTALIGAREDQINNNAQQGSAYVFTRNGATWSQQQQLTSPGAAQDAFGQSVALDGNTALCGALSENQNAANNTGAAYVFTRNGTTWTTQQRLIGSDGEAGDAFGSAVAVDGNTAVITSPTDDIDAPVNQGSAYVFTRQATSWTFRQKLTAGKAGDHFGQAAALKG